MNTATSTFELVLWIALAVVAIIAFAGIEYGRRPRR